MTSLTPEQERAVRAPKSHLIVSAGAGTGKTTVLVEKYLDHLIEKDVPAESILAITFTERASQEMEDRIRARLEAALKEERALEPPRERALFDRLSRSLDRSHIGTIHGFCAEVLRDHALEAGIDPKCQVLDEVRAEALRQKAVDQVLLLEKEPLPPPLALLLSEFPLSRLRGALGHLLARRLDAEGTLWRWSGLGPEAILKEWGEVCEKARREAAEGLLADPTFAGALSKIESLKGGKARDPGEQRRRSLLDAAKRLKEALEGSTPASLPSALQDLSEALSDKATGQKDNWDEGELSRFRENLGCLKETYKGYEKILNIPQGPLDERASRVAIALARLYGETAQIYEDLKAEEGGMDYDDLLSKTLALLRQNPRAKGDLKRRFHKLLVDEFQDTDPWQKEILDLLFAPEEKEVAKKERAQFLVGDARQAIYGFRGADVGLFQEVCSRWSPASLETGIETLSENRRSLPAILSFVNHVFGRVSEARTLRGETSSPAEDFPPLRGVRKEAPGGVELLLFAKGPSRVETLEAEAGFIAERILAWVGDDPIFVFDQETGERRPATFGDIAILLRAATHLSIYERALSRRGVPFESHTGRGFYRRPEVVDTLSALRWAERQRDEMALAALLRSPLVSLTDGALFLLSREGPLSLAVRSPDQVPLEEADREALLHFLEWEGIFIEELEREGLGRGLQTLWDRSGYRAFLAAQPYGAQALGHLKRLRLLAIQFEEEGNPWRDFIPFFEEMARGEAEVGKTETGEGGERVRLMTVHMAKGLEFPIVIIPDLAEDPKGRTPSLLVDRKWGIGFQLMDEKGESKPTALRTVIAWAEGKRRLSESQRLFYVAATRARDYLALSVSEGGKGDRGSWLSLLEAAFPKGDWEHPFGDEKFQMKVVRGAEIPQRARPVEIDFSGLMEEGPIEPASDAFLRLLEPISPGPPRHFTVTDLLTYRMCPRAFYYGAYLGLREPQRTAQGEETLPKEGPSGREVGDWVHLFLERWRGGPFEEVRGLPHPEEGEKEAWAEALRLLEKFRETDLAQEIEREESLAEVPFVLERDGALIRGRIDRLLRERDGCFRVLDFKTDRVQTAEEVARLARRYEFQVGLYALALKEMGLWTSAGVIHFLRPQVPHRFQVDGAFLDRIAQELDEALRGIKERDFHPDTQNCPTCPFPNLCSRRMSEHPRTSSGN